MVALLKKKKEKKEKNKLGCSNELGIDVKSLIAWNISLKKAW